MGDDFPRENFKSLETITNEAKSVNKPPPYMEDKYNVRALYKARSTAVSTVARMLNAVIDAMNEFDRLPKYIVVIPDSDIISYGGVYDDDASVMIYTLLRYLVKNINRKVDDRFEAIYKKKPGAVKAGEPRIAWVKMLDRPPSIGGKA